MRSEDAKSMDASDIISSTNDVKLMELLGVKRGERILEIGNSSGLFSICLAINGCGVTVLNTDASATERIRKSAENNGVQIDVRDSGSFDDAVGEYDTIILNYPQMSDENIELEIISRMMDQAPVYMKEDGRVVIVVQSTVSQKKLKALLSDLVIKKEVKLKAATGTLRIIEVAL